METNQLYETIEFRFPTILGNYMETNQLLAETMDETMDKPLVHPEASPQLRPLPVSGARVPAKMK